MKILVLVDSHHQGNTMKIAEAMAEAAPLTVVRAEEAAGLDFADYDIIGFGGGIYFGKHGASVTEAAGLIHDRPVFVFSTSGTGTEKNNESLVSVLKNNGAEVLGSFACKGLDKFFIFKLAGGINKGRPNEGDLENGKKFILEVIEKYNKKERK